MVFRVDWNDDAVAPLLPQSHQRVIDDDASEPGREARTAAELTDVPVCVEIRILQRILRLCIVPQDGPSHPEQLPVVPAHQCLEGTVVGPRNARHQRRVVARIRLDVEFRLYRHISQESTSLHSRCEPEEKCSRWRAVPEG